MIATLYWCWVFEQESGGIFLSLSLISLPYWGAVFTFSFLFLFPILSPCLVLCMGSLSLEFVLLVLLVVSIF